MEINADTIKKVVDIVKKKKIEASIGIEESYQITKWISSGVLAFDWVMGGKGFPCGRLVEIYGDFSSGKSWVAMKALAQAQKQNMISILIETEGSYDPAWANQLGIDTERLIVIKPESVEQAFDVMRDIMLGSDAPVAFVWDSLAATSTSHELEEGFEIRDMTKSQVIGKGLRMITSHVQSTNSLFIIVNQIREKIGVLYGEKEFTPGGKAVGFMASMRLKLSKIGKITGKEKEIIGQRIKLECTKSKIGIPFRWVETDFIFSEGISTWSGFVDLLKRLEYINMNGGWCCFIGDSKKWRESDFENVIMENPEKFSEILKKIFGE